MSAAAAATTSPSSTDNNAQTTTKPPSTLRATATPFDASGSSMMNAKSNSNHSNNSGDNNKPSCPLCSDDIDAYGAFDCGHFACYKCALRIRRSFRSVAGGGNRSRRNQQQQQQQQLDQEQEPKRDPPTCHQCRTPITSLTITEMPPSHPDTMLYSKAEMALLTKLDGVNTKRFLPLNCLVTSDACSTKLFELIQFTCPFDACWQVDRDTGKRSHNGPPFSTIESLQKHLRVEHSGVRYCDICVSQGYSFLSELQVYTPQELTTHMHGHCQKDVSAFGGHPTCKFCLGKTLYDGDAMLQHLKHVHYVCDFCNLTTYKFVYYSNRDALNFHWSAEHKLCNHPDCVQLDPVARVFASELELAKHMQARHGVKTTVRLDALGFTSTGSEVAVPLPRRGGAGAGPTAAEQELASQPSQRTTITYDFVGRTETVPLVPKFASGAPGSAQPAGGRGNSKAGGSKAAAAAAGGGGRGPGGRRVPVSASTNSNPGSARPAMSPAAAMAAIEEGVFGRGKNNNNNNNSRSQQQEAPIEVVIEEEDGTTVVTHHGGGDDDDDSTIASVDDADAILRKLVTAKLSSSEAKEFQVATVKYLREQMKALEYFGVLQKLFPDEHDLEVAHGCMVKTLEKNPNEQIRDALKAAKMLILSSEAKRAKQIAEEDEKERKREEVRNMHRQVVQGGSSSSSSSYNNNNKNSQQQRGSSGGRGGSGGGGSAAKALKGGGGGGRPQNVWQQRAEEQRVASSTNPESPIAVENGRRIRVPPSQQQGGASSSAWGQQQSSSSSPTTTAADRQSSAVSSPFVALGGGGGAWGTEGRGSRTAPKNMVRVDSDDASAPSLEQAFPTLQTSSNPRRKKNEPASPKGAWGTGGGEKLMGGK